MSLYTGVTNFYKWSSFTTHLLICSLICSGMA